MWIYESNICVLNLAFDSGAGTLFSQSNTPDFALHIIYNSNDDAWTMELVRKRENIFNFFNLDELTDWRKHNEGLTLENEVIYRNDSHKSLFENIDEVAKVTRTLIDDKLFPLLELYNARKLVSTNMSNVAI